MMKKIFALVLSALMCFSMVLAVSGATQDDPVLYDEAALLSQSEAEELTQKLRQISSTYHAQIVVMTIPSAEGNDVDEYANYIFDSKNIGYGEKRDGVLLLICMDPRELYIVCDGLAGDAIGDSGITVIGDAIAPDLSDGNYAQAFDIFADQCVYYIDGHLNGFPFDAGKSLLIALAVGLLVGLVVAFALKGQLKSVRKQERADVYVRPGSMQITAHSDLYLYRNLTRIKKESSSSGGRSSSGSSRHSGGRSF